MAVPLWIGAVFLLVSPGNWVRAGAGADNIGKFWDVIFSIKIFWIIALVAIVQLFRNNKGLWNFVRKNSLVVLALVLGLLMGIIAHTGTRSFTAIELFSALLLWRVVEPSFSNRFWGWWALAATLLVAHQAWITVENRAQYEAVMKATEEYKKSKTGTVVYNPPTPSLPVRPFVYQLKHSTEGARYEWRLLGVYLSGNRSRELKTKPE